MQPLGFSILPSEKAIRKKGFGLGLIDSDLNSEYGMHLAHYRDFEALPLTEQERVETELELYLERLDRLYINLQNMLNRSSIPPSLRQGLNRLLLGIRKVYLQKKSEAEILLGKGELEMDDAERLDRIEELYAALGAIEKDIQRLVQIHDGILAYQRSEQSTIRQTKTLYP